MSIVILTVDLAVISRVEGAALQKGETTRAVSSEAAAVERCIAERADLLIIDLGVASLKVVSLVGQVKLAMTSPPRIVAFGPHVHEQRLAAAREAGCDAVMSRGQFFAQLDAVLAIG